MTTKYANYSTEDFISNIFSAITEITGWTNESWSMDESDETDEVIVWTDDDGTANINTCDLPKILDDLLELVDHEWDDEDTDEDRKRETWDVLNCYIY